MADLDDFFAKKDRKKNKGKKFTTTDEIAKKLEETGKKIEKTKKEKPQPTPIPGQEGEEPIIETHEDDEWKEFEEEKKDYTGLKIGNLQITEGQSEGANDEGGDEGDMEENEAGEMVPRKKVQAGPWKMVNAEPLPAPAPEPERQKRPEQSSNLSSYVPPHLRNQPKEPLHSSSHRMKNRAAPDINNKDFFPTLSASKPASEGSGWGRRRREEGGGGGGSFEEVRNSKSHSGRGYADATNRSIGPGTGPKLSLGNKYGALSSDQS